MAFTDVVFTGNPPPSFTAPGSGATLTFTAVTTGSGATVTFTASSGAITAITATPAAQGSGCPVSSTIYFSISGGTGGIVVGTTSSSGTLTFSTTPFVAGTGYTSGTSSTSVLNIANYTSTSSGTGATVTFTASNGIIASITATPAAQGSGYPVSSTIYFLVAGGTGGVISGTTSSGGTLTFNTYPEISGIGYSSGTQATSTVTFTTPPSVTGGITSITGIGSGGSSYPANSGLYLSLAGGTGGIAYVTTNSSGVVTGYTSTPILAGKGYTSGTASTSIVSVSPGAGTFLTCCEENRGGGVLKDINIKPSAFVGLCNEMSRGNGTLKDIDVQSGICAEMSRGNLGTVTESTSGHRAGVELTNAFTTMPSPADVRNQVSYGKNGSQYTGTLIVGGAASGSATLSKASGSVAYGGSGNCAQFTPTSTTSWGYWHLYVPVVGSTSFVLYFYHQISSGWNGNLAVSIFDVDQATLLLSSQSVTAVNDGAYHQQVCTQATPSNTGMCLIRFEIINGSTSGFVYIDNIGIM